MTYTLIIFIYAGTFAKGDSVILDHVDGFATKQQCETAAAQIKSFVNGTSKDIEMQCIEVGK